MTQKKHKPAGRRAQSAHVARPERQPRVRPTVEPEATAGRVADLRPDPRNANKGNDRGREMLEASFRKYGAARSLVTDRNGVIIGGNKSQLAAMAAGITDAIVVPSDGRRLVVVRRTDLDAKDPKAAELAIADNRIAQVSLAWDSEVLQDLIDDGVDLSEMFSVEELAALLDGATKGRTDPDAIPAERPTGIKPGDLFQLGRHQLLCGDSTVAADVARVCGSTKPDLMVTDPPYGVNYDPKWRREAGVNNSDRMGAVANDDRDDWTEVWALFPGDVAYVYHAGVHASTVQASLERAKFSMRAQIIWRKPRIVLGRGHYHWQHEPCWYAVRKGSGGRWSGKRNQSTVWAVAGTVHRCSSCGSVEIESETTAELPSTIWDIAQKDSTGDTTHGTQKPVECMARPMRNHTAASVFEPFSGSGTTIIAGELTGRSVMAIELRPVYVQQAVDRWEAFTGKKATKVGEATAA